MSYEFYNPYNFVRTPDRNLTDSFAGDYDPSEPDKKENHSRYWEERYTGTIPVKLRVQTPLFITDPNSKDKDKEHGIYDCLDHIPATALKGMLSSAYEIITNSRYRVFSEKQHKERLGFRSAARATLVPGKVSEKDGKWYVTLLTGTTTIGGNSSDQISLCAAWLPAYPDGKENNLPKHGEWYEGVTLNLYEHEDKFGYKFKFWSVKDIPDVGEYKLITSNATLVSGVDPIKVNGYAVISGKIFSKKHDERFFFNYDMKTGTTKDVPPMEIPTDIEGRCEIKDRYETLIADYQRVHENDKEKKDESKYRRDHGDHIWDVNEKTLRDGCFVYVKMEGQKIKALYPVQISRELNEKAPFDCMHESLRPAQTMQKLSPADRLFGWVNPKGSGAWRGKVRISDGVFEGKDPKDEPIHKFTEPMPLSILGAPKPAQARFYLGDEYGNPQKPGLSKEDVGYKGDKKLRGRKVYLHHCRLTVPKDEKESYWDEIKGLDLEIRPEYRQLQGDNERTNQNRSITGWIPKKKEFFFDIKVENLTHEELGAVLTLLTLGGERYFRLGYGKPLGLGSVSLSLAKPEEILPVVKGKALKERYESLTNFSQQGLTSSEREKIVQDYKKTISEVYSGKFDDVDTIDFFPWKQHEFFSYLSDAEQQNWMEAWRNALDKKEQNAPLEKLPLSEDLFDMFPTLSEELIQSYQKLLGDIEKQKKNDYGWSKLSFIEELMLSMKGFDDAPVTYPRNKKARSEERGEEGFSWFVNNENEKDKKVINGYVLPRIAKKRNFT